MPAAVASPTLDPRLSASSHSKMLRHAVQVYEETLRLLFANAMQDGHLPGTEKLPEREELQVLAEAEEQLREKAQSSMTEIERNDAFNKLLRLGELRGKFNGTNGSTSS